MHAPRGMRRLEEYGVDVGRQGELLTAEEEQELGHAVQQGDTDARNELVARNLRLVLAEALKYRWECVPVEDLVQAGNMGLLRAAQRFDPERGYRFSTYATYWVRQGVHRAFAEDGRTIRAPYPVFQLCGRVTQLRDQNPGITDLEIADMLQTTVDEVEYSDRMRRHPLSLDYEAVNDMGERDRPLHEQMGELGQPSAEAALRQRMLQDDITEALSRLPLRIRRAVELYYLRDPAPSLNDVGAVLGLSGERARQLVKEGLRRLSHDDRLESWNGAGEHNGGSD
jgi:RNA polymerase sigma factor (sigma-70 family)